MRPERHPQRKPARTMAPKFLARLGSIYRILLESDGGSWLIPYDPPAAPFFASSQALQEFERIQAPESFLLAQDAPLTPAQEKRMALIQPLVDTPACVTDKAVRTELVYQIAEEYKTSFRRVANLYFRYLATGRLTERKSPRVKPRNELFDWTIQTYYYSAKKMSLRAAYDMMLIQRFTNASGHIADDAPTWGQFRHYFYSRDFHKNPKKVIARDGLTHYQRNLKPLHGSAAGWRRRPGSYQMDATQADIYLVSRFDRSAVAGRPYIYMAVDTSTQLVAGIYVGFDCDESAVMSCIAQAAGDKELYCRQHGIEIEPGQWPSHGMPEEIITDKGREFFGPRMAELCRRYGVEVQSLPPFRPDRKGLVEKAFDLLQGRYKPLLRGKGVIEEDAQERWATDYRTQAVLDLEEFTQVVIHAALYLNSGRILEDGKTPAQRWLEAEPQLLDVPIEELYLQTLPREEAKLTRKGFRLNGIWYAPVDMDGLFQGDAYTLAYDPADISRIHIVFPDGYRPCEPVGNSAVKGKFTATELETARHTERAAKRTGREREVASSVSTAMAIQNIVQKAAQAKEPVEVQDGEAIRRNQAAEKGKLT